MALSVATNNGALMAAAAASSVNKDMDIAMERLSTGKRINAASDDAAGVAIASRLSSEIRGTNTAIRNTLDAQAMLDTAEGAHAEIENILQRMRDLAVQAANDTNDDTDRANLQAEMTQLATEIDRIAEVTTWAGQTLLNGSGGTASNGQFTYQIGGRTGGDDRLGVTIDAMDSVALGISTTIAVDVVNASVAGSGDLAIGDLSAVYNASGDVSFASGGATEVAAKLTVTANSGDTDVFSVRIAGEDVTYTQGAGGFDDNSAGVAAGLAAAIEAAGIQGVRVEVSGAKIAIFSGSSNVITDAESARDMVDAIDDAITQVNTQRAELGAYSNRLDSTVRNMTNVVNNLQAGLGRIQDADFAAETTALSKSQILQQASTAMLAQANASKQNVLSLLQG